MSDDLRIRAFEPRDLPAVVQIFTDGMRCSADGHTLFSDHYISESIKSDLHDIDASYSAPGGGFWVAITGDQVVGMIGLQFKRQGEGELRRLCVKSDFRRRGVGKKLMAHMEQWAKSKSFATVSLWLGGVLSPLREYYLAAGYTLTQTFVVSQVPYLETMSFTKQL